MSWISYMILILLLGAAAYSIHLRMGGRGYRIESLPVSPSSGGRERPAVVSSAFSVALTQLVGVAGGIYLGLITLVSFLQMDVPQKVDLGFVRFDPLAAIAMLLALVQPLLVRRRR